MAKRAVAIKREVLKVEDIEETMKALEKISAANLHFLEIATERMRAYENSLKIMLLDIADKISEEKEEKWFSQREKGKKLNIVITAKKGLCGNLFNNLLDYLRKNYRKGDDIFLLGEKGKELLRERGLKFTYFLKVEEAIPKIGELGEMKEKLISYFLEGKYKEIIIFWPRFQNIGLQIPAKTTFLPIEQEKFQQELGQQPILGNPQLVIYEPNEGEIIDYLMKEYLKIGLYQKVLEAKLSELSARTVMMEEGQERIKKIVKKLFLQYFRRKREMVTKEITDLFSHRLI